MSETEPNQRRKRPITDREVAAAAKVAGKHSCGDGLILVVGSPGRASWIARVLDPSGRRRDIGLGKYPEVGVKEARERVAELRRQTRDGIDPVAAKREARRRMPTFAEAAQLCFDERRDGFRNLKHRDQWISTLRVYAFPHFGHLPVDQVDRVRVVQAMKPLWTAKPETARRVLQRIERVIVWAVGNGHRESELPMRSIREALPSQPKRREASDTATSVGNNFAAVPVEAAPVVMAALRSGEPPLSALCLQLAILTAARSNEARSAQWQEVDLDAATWTIPASRMKAGRDHTVALSPDAVALLRSIPRRVGSDLIFPSLRGKPMSDVALSKTLKRHAPGATVHGWRSTFRDWAAERTNFAGEVAEAALAHTVRDKVEAAYRRTNFLEKRRDLMAAWSDFLAGRGAEIVSLDDRRKQSAG